MTREGSKRQLEESLSSTEVFLREFDENSRTKRPRLEATNNVQKILPTSSDWPKPSRLNHQKVQESPRVQRVSLTLTFSDPSFHFELVKHSCFRQIPCSM